MNPLRIILHLAVNMAAVATAAWLLPGVAFASFLSLFLATIVLGIINTLIRPVLHLITLPISIITLGLFSLVINAALVLLAAQIVPGFIIAGFWWALAFSVTLGLVSWFLHLLEGRK